MSQSVRGSTSLWDSSTDRTASISVSSIVSVHACTCSSSIALMSSGVTTVSVPSGEVETEAVGCDEEVEDGTMAAGGGGREDDDETAVASDGGRGDNDDEEVEADVDGDGDVEVDRDGGDVAGTTGESDVGETCF